MAEGSLLKELRDEVATLKKQVAELQQILGSRSKDQRIELKSQCELLEQDQLAKRLRVDSRAINQHKTDGREFTEWSRSKDPDMIAWEYKGANRFHPQIQLFGDNN